MENPAIKYDEILAGVGYFYCDYYRCRMSKTACLRNQEMGKQTYREVGARFFYLGKKFVVLTGRYRVGIVVRGKRF